MQTAALRIGIVGAGAITRMQHIPAIAGSDRLHLAALADPRLASGGRPGVQGADIPEAALQGVSLHGSLGEMLEARHDIDCVAICTPPQARYRLAAQAIAAGRHVLLEKPPAATTTEIACLADQAAAARVVLFTAWHALFSAAVVPAREILARRGVSAMRILWKEDVDKFHPGADWFWKPGGLGVFDAGINALSIVAGVMPEPVFVRSATFRVAPGQNAPASVRLGFATPSIEDGLDAEFDWNHKGQEVWSIDWTLDDGAKLQLGGGGAWLALDGERLAEGPDTEYARLYAHFAGLVADGRSDIETRPLQLVADAFLLARFAIASEARR